MRGPSESHSENPGDAPSSARREAGPFETVLNQAPLGVFVVDAEFRIALVNPIARPAFGDIADLIGRDFGEVLHVVWQPRYADELVRIFHHTLETGEHYETSESAEFRIDRGVMEYYEWRLDRIALSDGRHGVVCYFRDISQHIKSRRELFEQREELQAMHRQKDEFLAMLAHELRNPLAPIRNAAELLARITPPSSEVQKTIGVIRRQIEQLTRLVDDLLDVSRITQGRIELRQETVDLADVIAHALETVQPLVGKKCHQVAVSYDRESLHVHGDSARLVQCVANILANAVKYTEPNGTIEITVRRDESQAVICIADNGPGISPELLPHIFDLFVQGGYTLDRSHGGLGLGLSLVKELVHRHGGTVSARSAGIGSGATFEVRLPLSEKRPSTAPPAPTRERSKQRVLVVDDNIDAADSLAMVLRIDGHTVDTAYGGRQALERMDAFNPDVVLLDIGLPEMDGFEVARRIRGARGFEGVRLIAVTGYGQPEDRERTRDTGFDAHLVKPISPAELAATIAPPKRQ